MAYNNDDGNNIDNVKEYLSTISNKLKFFVHNFYDNNFAKFAKITGIKESTLSRLKKGEDTSISMLAKVEKAGLSLTWIVGSDDSFEKMFANNDLGKSFEEYFNGVKSIDGFKIYDQNVGFRAKDWIEDKYGTIENVFETADFWRFDKKSLINILNGTEVPDTRFVNFMIQAGCSRKYLLNEITWLESIGFNLYGQQQLPPFFSHNRWDKEKVSDVSESSEDIFAKKLIISKEIFEDMMILADKMKETINDLQNEFDMIKNNLFKVK